MKNILKTLPLVFLLACGSNDEVIKKQIIQKKQQIVKLEQQIIKLEKQLSDTAETDKRIPVEVKEIKPEEFNHYFIAYGNVEAKEYALISPEGAGGQIKKIHMDEGDFAKKGQLLISLNKEVIAKQIDAVKSNLELVTSTYEKQKTLWDQGIGSEIQYLQAKTNKESLEAQLESLEAQERMSTIRAPFDGYVDKIFQKEGELASAMFPVVEFVNYSELIIIADISENYVGKIKEGDYVDLTFASLPDYQKRTRIKRVSNVLNKDSRTFEIELNIDNINKQIKPNMVSTIRINDFSSSDAFVIPTLVIRKDITGNYVYVAKEKEGQMTVGKKYITPDLSYNDQTMIAKGLSLGDKVIVKGYNLVSSGVPVNVK
ncbi:MAG: efflux RND transporter periplasmic adaptor subunit [Bacteroidales bacterium]|nr:efflux RND transporter periplasmic adaptor subunit [Bacteroidales bacterium]